MRLHIKDGYVTVDVYDGSGVTRGDSFKGKIWSEGCRVCDFLLIGW